MAPRARETKIAVKDAAVNNGTRRKRSTMASADPNGPRRSKQTSQAERAYKEQSAGNFDYDLAWHENCVFDLDEAEHGFYLYVFADGSIITEVEDKPYLPPRGEILRFLSTALIDAYDHCLEHEEEFVLWIAGERFTGTPKEAFEAILCLLDPPVVPPKRMLGLIEDSTIRLNSYREYKKATMSNARMLIDGAKRLLASGALDVQSLNRMIGMICKEHEGQDEQQ